MELSQKLQVGLFAGAVFDCRNVTLEFSVGIFAKNDDCNIGPGFEVAIVAELGSPAGPGHGFRDAGVNRFSVREVLVGDARALPGNGPPAALLADIVSTITADEHVGVRRQG
jgi:hypothetical protein